MNKNVKLSPFLYFLKISNEHYAVYNALHIKKFYCDKNTVKKIKNLDLNSKLFLQLYNERFIIDKNINTKDEINLVIKNQGMDFDRPKFKVFYMIITTGCNFRCKYCYLSTLVNHKARVMDIDTAKSSLTYFVFV